MEPDEHADAPPNELRVAIVAARDLAIKDKNLLQRGVIVIFSSAPSSTRRPCCSDSVLCTRISRRWPGRSRVAVPVI